MPSSADCDAFEVCGRCGDRLTGTDWYPAATRVATDGEILVLSFCDERCRVAWDDAD